MNPSLLRPTRPCSIYTATIIVLSITFFYHLWPSHRLSSATSFRSAAQAKGAIQNYFSHQASAAEPQQPASSKPIDHAILDSHVRNQTLGFQKVFMLGLPERGDRRDAFTVAASLTGFSVDFVDGVDGKLVSEKSIPLVQDHLKDDSLHARVGTWRAHVNVARKIVQEGITSALIFEDDSDWDVSLKDRMVDFARGSRFFARAGDGEARQPATPYGDDWDMLWLGHCSLQQQTHSDEAKQRYILENDVSVPYPANRVNFDNIPNMAMFPRLTRTIIKAERGVCLYGYALSFRGAQKILYAQSSLKYFTPVDLAYGDMCADRTQPFHCIGVYPQIIDSHKQAGALDRDSNIGEFDHSSVREFGYTFNIRHSTRLNVMRLLRGEPIQSQWPDQHPVEQPGGIRHALANMGEEPNINISPFDKYAKMAIDDDIPEAASPAENTAPAQTQSTTGLPAAPSPSADTNPASPSLS